MSRLPSVALLIALVSLGLPAQAPDERLAEASGAWDRGDYASALETYLALLEQDGGGALLDRIALETGEEYRTQELTADGGAPRFAPDGRHFSFELGRGATRTTRISSTASPGRAAADLPGFAAVFSPDGQKVAYLRPAAAAAPAPPAGATRTDAHIIVRDLPSGAEQPAAAVEQSATFLIAGDGVVLFTRREAEGAGARIHAAGPGGPAAALTTGERDHVLLQVNRDGSAALFLARAAAGGTPLPPQFGIITLPQRTVTLFDGMAPAFSPDGRRLAYVTRGASDSQLVTAIVASPAATTLVRSGPEALDAPQWSPDGTRLAFQLRRLHDWDLYVAGTDGSGEQRITSDIQHDVLPRFLTATRLLGLMGEPRHRRSYVYDLQTGARARLFHNNTVRTISPEYAWTPHPDGTKLLVVAERDGDTISPERGVYLMDLAQRVTREELTARLRASLAGEEALARHGSRVFAPIAQAVRTVVSGASPARVFDYEQALYRFGSKHITRPGNRLASTYLHETYRSFGYQPEYQWLSSRAAHGGQTANVLAALKGTTNPEIVYVVSSHYDSIPEGPGADDNTSGTAALLEAARILARHPQPATILFASFTGEESGLLGSREFVRRATADGLHVAGALNNDMIGWANDHRLDATIRYSNAGIRDIQHAAAMQFTNLITYDTVYYRGTDAHAYYDAYGDIVGGLGAYPILGSPHYHLPHDTIDTVNHQLVTEVAKTTAATLMLLASSPARLTGVKATLTANGVDVTWTPARETGVSAYLVSWTGPGAAAPPRQLRVTEPRARIAASKGDIVSVKALNDRGLESWDWARARVE